MTESIAGGIDTRLAPQCVHTQAGIVGNGGYTGGSRHGGSLEPGVLFKSRPGFFHFKITAGLPLGEELDVQIRHQGTEFLQLVRIVAGQNQFHLNSASTNVFGSKGIRSSICSPTPTYLTGSPSLLAMAKTMPPLAVPSSFVRIIPVRPAVSRNCSA